MISTSGVLAPSMRSKFTIDRETATWLAGKLASGTCDNLTFQSYANRNWVAKIARTRYGVTTNVFAVKDQLVDPRHTVEGRNTPDKGIANEAHWMNVYRVEVVKATVPTYSTPSWHTNPLRERNIY